MTVPDAPWIRDAETNGVPEPPVIRCPLCQAECETIYIDLNGDEAGCENCIKTQDSYDWFREHYDDDPWPKDEFDPMEDDLK